MRRLGLLALAWACGGEPVLFTSAEGRFSVWMPAQPREYSSPADTGAADRSHTIAAEGPEALYAVTYHDLLAAPPDPSGFLTAHHERALRDAPGTVVSNRPITLAGHPGLETEIRFSDGTRARTRYVLADRRLYQVIVFGLPEETFGDRFLESFTLR